MDNPDTNYANLASAILENAGYSSDSSITIPTTSASTFPTAPFYATIMPTTDLANSTNSEIVKVTSSSVSGADTTFNITRSQRGTNAINWDAGKAVLVHAIYTQDVMAQSQGYYNAVLTGTNFDITNASAPTTPVVGSHMRVVFDTTVATATALTITVNSGTAYPLKVGSAIYTQMTTLANMSITTGVVYELNFDGTNWVAQNTHAQITTNDIADGAVTSNKIDWATRTYSTTEKIVGTDTDGKTIYERTWVASGVSFAAATNNSFSLIVSTEPTVPTEIVNAFGHVAGVQYSGGPVIQYGLGAIRISSGSVTWATNVLFSSGGSLQLSVYSQQATTGTGYYRITVQYAR